MAVAVETPEQAQSDTSNARSALKVVLAILMAAEALWAVAFALAKTGSDLSLPALMRELHLHYILPLALVGDVIVVVPACVITLVATVALWQDGWGRAGLIGPRKRAAVWGALFLQLVIVGWSLLLTARVAAMEAISPGFAVPVLILAAGAGWIVRKPPYSDVRRGTVVVLASVLAAIGLVGVL